MRDAIILVFWDMEHKVEFTNKNKDGSYISLSVKAKIISDDERYKLCALLAKQLAVKMALVNRGHTG
jgi:hypothetical protein